MISYGVACLQESEVDTADLSEALVMHCAEMGYVTKEELEKRLDRFSSWVVGLLCLNLVMLLFLL